MRLKKMRLKKMRLKKCPFKTKLDEIRNLEIRNLEIRKTYAERKLFICDYALSNHFNVVDPRSSWESNPGTERK